jgi:hypothetical protein
MREDKEDRMGIVTKGAQATGKNSNSGPSSKRRQFVLLMQNNNGERSQGLWVR